MLTGAHDSNVAANNNVLYLQGVHKAKPAWKCGIDHDPLFLVMLATYLSIII